MPQTLSMKIIYNPKNITGGQALALGNFDGFHRGHKAIIEKTKEIAQKKGLKPGVITFEPHPITLFKPDILPVRINDLHGKMALLAQAGVENCYIIKFTRHFSQMKAHEFIDRYLTGNHIVTGFNFAFGHNREGSPEMLHQVLGGNYTQVEPVQESGSIYSSSMVRMAIKSGEIKMANGVLGYNYFITGKVLRGAGKGAQIGFPTANIKLKPSILRPKYGVYAVNTNYGRGVANFGVRPTVDGKNEFLEVHIFDFAKKIYDEKLKVEFLDFIRAEKTYNSFDELKEQIKKDAARAKEIE